VEHEICFLNETYHLCDLLRLYAHSDDHYLLMLALLLESNDKNDFISKCGLDGIPLCEVKYYIKKSYRWTFDCFKTFDVNIDRLLKRPA
jgi:hypothetical protein